MFQMTKNVSHPVTFTALLRKVMVLSRSVIEKQTQVVTGRKETLKAPLLEKAEWIKKQIK